MIDVKKLMASFLALAAVGAFAAFLISNPNFYKGTMGARYLGAAQTPVPANAFLASTETTPLALRENLGGGSPNLTAAAAQNIAQVILALNPNGPQQLPDGTTGFIVPTTTLLTAYVAMESPSFSVNNLWTSPDSETIVSAAANDTSANQQYAAAFRSIMKNTIADPGFIMKAKTATTVGLDNTDFLATAAATFGNASHQLKMTPVPAPFISFDKNFLAYLDDQQTALAVLADNRDPMKSMLVLASGPQVQNRITSDYMNAIGQYRTLNLTSLLAQAEPPKNTWLNNTVAFANRIAGTFSIPTALAQDVTVTPTEDNCGKKFLSSFSDLTGNIGKLFGTATATDVPVAEATLDTINATILEDQAASLGILVYECQQQALAEQTKKSESDIMTQVQTNAIQNNGNPRVITDFAQYQQDAANRAGIKAYKQISAQICPQFQPAVDALVFNPASTNLANQGTNLNGDNINTSSTSASGTPSSTASSSFGSSQIDGTGSQCSLPSQDSSTGSGTGDGQDALSLFLTQTADPNGSLYGTIIGAHDQINSAMGNAAAGAQAESIANQGLRSQVDCVDYYTDANGNKICDQTQVTKPGSVVGSEIQATISTQLMGIMSSNDPSQIQAQFANSLWAQLQENPNQGLVNLMPQTADSLGSLCNSLAPPGSNSGQNPAYAACNSAMGKIINAYDKYAQLAQTVGSLLNGFSNPQSFGGL